jgi:hypothetical protein
MTEVPVVPNLAHFPVSLLLRELRAWML